MRLPWNPGMLALGWVALALMVNAVWFGWPSADPPVRKVAVLFGDNAGALAPVGITVFRSVQELELACPQIELPSEHAVEFGDECLVRVVWESAGVLSDGPNVGATRQDQVEFGRLQYRARLVGRRILFFVEEPRQYGTVRNVFQQVHRDEWFAVSNHAQVAFVGPQWITLCDGVIVLSSIGLAGLGLTLVRRRHRVNASQVCSPPNNVDSDALATPKPQREDL